MKNTPKNDAKANKDYVRLLDITGANPLYMELIYACVKHQPKIKELHQPAIKEALLQLCQATGELLHIVLQMDGEIGYAHAKCYVDECIVERVADIVTHSAQIIKRDEERTAERRPS